MHNLQGLDETNKEESSRFDSNILFLQELIDNFTRDLNIQREDFYSRVNSVLRNFSVLSGLRYNKFGLLGFPEVFKSYQKSKESVSVIYAASPYMNSLSSLLSAIFSETSNVLGLEKTKMVFKDSFEKTKKSYAEIPNVFLYDRQE